MTIDIVDMKNSIACRTGIALFLIIISALLPEDILAQRRGAGEGRHAPAKTIVQDAKNRVRRYDLSLDFGLGNLLYEEFGRPGVSQEQSNYTGDLFAFKAIVGVAEIKGSWSIDIGGEAFSSADKLERWWTRDRLFRTNKLHIKGLSMETVVSHGFDEMALFPFQILAKPKIGIGLVYRFHGVRRGSVQNFLENDLIIAKETDYALFGIEPGFGMEFVSPEGKMTGFVDIGTGMYGVTVENYYEGKGISTSPDKTYGRSVLGRVGIRGMIGMFDYQIGYYVLMIKVKSKGYIPESRTGYNRLFCTIGAKF